MARASRQANLSELFPRICPIGPCFLGFIDGGANAFLGGPWQDFFATCEVFWQSMRF